MREERRIAGNGGASEIERFRREKSVVSPQAAGSGFYFIFFSMGMQYNSRIGNPLCKDNDVQGHLRLRNLYYNEIAVLYLG